MTIHFSLDIFRILCWTFPFLHHRDQEFLCRFLNYCLISIFNIINTSAWWLLWAEGEWYILISLHFDEVPKLKTSDVSYQFITRNNSWNSSCNHALLRFTKWTFSLFLSSRKQPALVTTTFPNPRGSRLRKLQLYFGSWLLWLLLLLITHCYATQHFYLTVFTV